MVEYLLSIVNIIVIAAVSHCSDEKIIGGKETVVEEFPFQVSIQENGIHICSGSIISTFFIIAAAHCVDHGLSNQYKIRAGTSNYAKGGSIHKIKNIFLHPNYNLSTHDFDVSLLELEKSLQFNIGIFAIDLPEANQVVKIGTIGICSGWGVLADDVEVSKHLQYTKAKIIDRQKCESLYKGNVITARMLCAEFIVNQNEIYQGDSGGPLVANGELIGLVSWGYGTSKPSYPGIYTNIAQLRSFISSLAHV